MALLKRLSAFLKTHRHLYAAIVFVLVASIGLSFGVYYHLKASDQKKHSDTSDTYNSVGFIDEALFSDIEKIELEPSKPKQSSSGTSTDKKIKKVFDYTKIVDQNNLKKYVYYFTRKYKDLVKLYRYGKSVQDRELYVLTIGNGSRKVLFNAGIHSREHITISFALRMVEEYCIAYYDSGYFGNFDLKKLFSEFTVYVIPNCNPDGVEIIKGASSPSVKTSIESMNMFKANANGVNLNRNFPYCWKSVNMGSSVPHSENFKGYSPASEPETKCLIGLCLANDFEFMISLHIKGDCIYWDDVKNQRHTGLNLTKRLCVNLGFSACEVVDDPNLYGGCFENWFSYKFDKPGLCVELMPSYIESSGNTNANLIDFDNCTRWNTTKYLMACALYYTL